MSLAIGVASSSKSMAFDENDSNAEHNNRKKKSSEDTKKTTTEVAEAVKETTTGLTSTTTHNDSISATEDEEDDEGKIIQLGPQFTLKQQLEKDKDDESLRRWKEQLLGTVDMNSVGENLEPEVKIISLAIKSPGRPDIVLTIPENGNPKGLWFTLKEGSHYSLMFTFKVAKNIVSGLKYTNTVWKTGVKVDNTKEMLGTFSPQLEPYTFEFPEDITPSGIFARGSYSARSKFLDDDGKRYLEINYTFDIRKDWHSS